MHRCREIQFHQRPRARIQPRGQRDLHYPVTTEKRGLLLRDPQERRDKPLRVASASIDFQRHRALGAENSVSYYKRIPDRQAKCLERSFNDVVPILSTKYANMNCDLRIIGERATPVVVEVAG